MSPFLRTFVLFLIAGFVFAGLDLLWLGMVMGDYYDAQLGPLKAHPVLKAPAVLFYIFYLGFLLRYGVLRAVDSRESLQRGSLMGLFAYGTYEFTNWAVIQDWPAGLVLVDILWGVVLTGAVCGMTKICERKLPSQ